MGSKENQGKGEKIAENVKSRFRFPAIHLWSFNSITNIWNDFMRLPLCPKLHFYNEIYRKNKIILSRQTTKCSILLPSFKCLIASLKSFNGDLVSVPNNYWTIHDTLTGCVTINRRSRMKLKLLSYNPHFTIDFIIFNNISFWLRKHFLAQLTQVKDVFRLPHSTPV